MNVPRLKTESAVNVTKLGYVAFETPDVDRLVEYYTKILDFTVVDRSPEGAFLTTGFDHHCVVITRAAAAKGRTATGYEISEPLDDAERRLRDAGYEVERRTDIGPGTPDVLVLAEPTTGTPMYLMTAQEPSGAWPTMLRPTKLGHVASFTPGLDALEKFYKELLGFKWSDTLGDFFVSCVAEPTITPRTSWQAQNSKACTISPTSAVIPATSSPWWITWPRTGIGWTGGRAGMARVITCSRITRTPTAT